MDLLVCRNLLIYLDTETQDQVLPRLHYALADDGFMFLGKAETQLARSKLFEPVDPKHRIFFRKVPQEWRRSPGGSLAFAGANAGQNGRMPPMQTRLLEALADTTTTAYLAVDQEGVLVLANAGARRLLDVGEGDLGRPFQDLPVSYRPAELRSRIEEAARLGRPVRLEHQEYHRLPAEPVRVTIEVTPVFGGDGRQFATLISFADTTRAFQMRQELEAAQESLETTIEELQSANEELQSTNEELEAMNEELRRHSDEAAEYHRFSESILRSIDGGVVVLDQDLKVRSWNRKSENAWGLRAEDVVGRDFLSLDVGLPVERLHQHLHRVLGAEVPQSDVVLEAVDRRGQALRCRVRLSPLLYEDRAPRGAVLIIEDATDEERDQEYTRYLGRIIGQPLNEVYFLDPLTLRFLLINRVAEEKLGYSIGQLQQRAITDLMPGVPSEMLRVLVAPLLAGKQLEVVFETIMRAHSGREYPAEICLQYFAQERPPILLAIVHDISERRRLTAAD